MARERILLLYLKTGGGHLAAARALEQNIKERYSREDVEVVLCDPLPNDNAFWKAFFLKGYGISANRFRFLWVGAYELTRVKFLNDIWKFVMIFLFWKSIAEAIEREKVTKIVFLHALLIYPTRFALKRLKKKIPGVTVVLDPFTGHNFWFHRFGNPVIVFSDKLVREAIDIWGFPRRLVHKFPIILRREFSGKPLEPERVRELKAKHGFSPDKRVVLLAGGGEGLPHGERYTEALLSSSIDAEIAVVCGKDSFMKKNIERLVKRYPQKSVHVYGFIDFMFELMNVADIIVSKGGPATVLEALMLEKPLIVSQYVFGQERGNVDFVRNERVGFYSSDPKEIVRHIERLVADPSIYRAYRDRIRALKLRNGTQEIADFIVNYQRPQRAEARQPLALFVREMFDAASRRSTLKQIIEHLSQLATESGLRRRKL